MLNILKPFLILLLVLPAIGDDGLREKSNQELIEMLLIIDQQTIGLHGTASMNTFLAEGLKPKFSSGVISSQAPIEYPQMKELVSRGVEALPLLLKHLDDKRETKLRIGEGEFTFIWSSYGEEYDPRLRELKSEKKILNWNKPVELPYTVRIGDVCYALIGQIVGRNLLPIRYQPSGGLIVNSPAKNEILAEKTRKDWNGVTLAQLEKVWINDIQQNDHVWTTGPAIQRLRYYIPTRFKRLKYSKFRGKIREYLEYENK